MTLGSTTLPSRKQLHFAIHTDNWPKILVALKEKNIPPRESNPDRQVRSHSVKEKIETLRHSKNNVVKLYKMQRSAQDNIRTQTV